MYVVYVKLYVYFLFRVGLLSEASYHAESAAGSPGGRIYVLIFLVAFRLRVELVERVELS